MKKKQSIVHRDYYDDYVAQEWHAKTNYWVNQKLYLLGKTTLDELETIPYAKNIWHLF